MHLVASFGVNWRQVEETLAAIRAARDAGFRWVEFDHYDCEYLPRVRESALRAHMGKLLALGGALEYFAAETKALRLGFALRPLTRYVVQDSMAMAGMIRVPLECVDDTEYWARIARSPYRPLVLYETQGNWSAPTTGRVPVFVAPGWPAEPKAYRPFLEGISPEHRMGLAIHGVYEELFQAAAVRAAPVVIQPVRPDAYTQAPDAAIAAAVATTAEWIEALTDAEAPLEE